MDATLIQPLNDDPAEQPTVIKVAPTAGVQANFSLTLAEAYRRYIDDPTRAWTANTREAYETSRRLAIAVIGEAVPIASISRTHCRDFLDVLRFLPANASKLFPKLSPREAADRARLRGNIKVISAANANSLMSNMSSFLNRAVNEELLGRNPARGLRLPDPVSKRDKRFPFSRCSFMRSLTPLSSVAASTVSAATTRSAISAPATRISGFRSSLCSLGRGSVKYVSLM